MSIIVLYSPAMGKERAMGTINDTKWRQVARSVMRARWPEEVFGSLAGTPEQQRAAAHHVYRRLARAIHPDVVGDASDHAEAAAAFVALDALWRSAEQRIRAGSYGAEVGVAATAGLIRVRGRARDYMVGDLVARGDVANLYRCTFDLDGSVQHGLFKVARDPADSDLLDNEAAALRRLAQDTAYGGYAPYVPSLVETLRYTDTAASRARQANVLLTAGGLMSLACVMEAYPRGIDPRDMAWMQRRLLIALSFTHGAGLVHGAVLPSHVLIKIEDEAGRPEHGLVLAGWGQAVAGGTTIAAISAPYEAWYPAEVTAKQRAGPGTDIFMAAACMIALLGGDPVSRGMPTSVPSRLQAFLRGCMLPRLNQRPDDAGALDDEFTALIERLWGPRRFRPFSLPVPA
jgi:hypothetical protein